MRTVGVEDTACTVHVGQKISPEGAREDAAEKARTPFDNSAASGRTRAAILPSMDDKPKQNHSKVRGSFSLQNIARRQQAGRLKS